MQGKTKGLLGCGGCGCLTAFILAIAGGVLYSVLDIGPGIFASYASGPLCVLSGLILVVGIIFMMKDKKAATADDE